MTAVEFFDRAPIDNVISSLTTAPDKIIFIGDGKVMKKFGSVYESFLERRGLNVELEYREIKKNDINNIVEVLSQIVETEEQCVFDLTGGEDLVLVAMGIVFQKYSHKPIQMQHFNIRNGVVTDCDNDGTVIYSGIPQITVDENIKLYGGTVRYKADGDDRTFRWDLTDDFAADVEKMWQICRENPGLWNLQLNILEAVSDNNSQLNSLNVFVSVFVIQEHLKHSGAKADCINDLLELLYQNNLIYSYTNNGKNISFVYKNEQVKKCLTKAGTVLELKVLITANSLVNDDGTAYYTDSMNGVYIDWDGDLHDITDIEKDTENEIDVVLMKGLTPVFISCKNGRVDDDELYKLETVAGRFGGMHVKKVLIATYLGGKEKGMDYFKQRAADMKIKFIEGVHKLSDEEFAKMVKRLING